MLKNASKVHFFDEKIKFESFSLGFSTEKVNPSILGNLELLKPSLAFWRSSLVSKNQPCKIFRNFEKLWL